MVIMNLELENILGFPNFKMNFSYPKKIVNSIIEGEHLAGRPSGTGSIPCIRCI